LDQGWRACQLSSAEQQPCGIITHRNAPANQPIGGQPLQSPIGPPFEVIPVFIADGVLVCPFSRGDTFKWNSAYIRQYGKIVQCREVLKRGYNLRSQNIQPDRAVRYLAKEEHKYN
jgi:hypothetical protein